MERSGTTTDSSAPGAQPDESSGSRHALLIFAYVVSLLAPFTGQAVVAALLYWTVYRNAATRDRRRVIWIGLGVAVAETLLIMVAIQSGLVAQLVYSAEVVQGPGGTLP